MKQTAILVVSFGSTHLDTLERCISATEKAIADRFPELPLYRAFTSNIVIRRLKEQQGIQVDTVKEALERMKAQGITHVAVQPTLILGGYEFDLLNKLVDTVSGLKTEIGRPLILNEEDCAAVAQILQDENPLSDNEALVLMGHGTEHQANEIYTLLQKKLDEIHYNCIVGTVEGTPSFEDAVKLLKQRASSKAKLLPLMFVAGDHAKNDMAGDEEDSLLTLVQSAGVEAEPVVRGLGESTAIREAYILRTKEAIDRLKTKVSHE